MAFRRTGKVAVVGVDFQDTRQDAARALIRQTGVRYPLYADEQTFRRITSSLTLVAGKIVSRSGRFANLKIKQ